MNSQRESFLYKLTQIFLILGAILLLYLLLTYVYGSNQVSSFFRGVQNPISGIIANLDGIGRGISNMFAGLLR